MTYSGSMRMSRMKSPRMTTPTTSVVSKALVTRVVSETLTSPSSALALRVWAALRVLLAPKEMYV